MRPPKTIAGPVCLWLPRILPGVGAYFNFVGASERLSRTGTDRRKRTSGHAWTGVGSICGMLVGFPLQGVHRFESPRLSDMSNRLFVVKLRR
jgi:hypothetical protein